MIITIQTVSAFQKIVMCNLPPRRLITFHFLSTDQVFQLQISKRSMSDDSAGLPPALAGHRSLDPAGNLASNSEQLDYVVEQPASQWLDFVRKLRNLTGTLETRYFSQHMLDDIESKYGNNRERCRRAVLKWQNASSDHSIKELCCALRDSSHGLVADTLERSCNYPEV